jgi:hypothetical protein
VALTLVALSLTSLPARADDHFEHGFHNEVAVAAHAAGGVEVGFRFGPPRVYVAPTPPVVYAPAPPYATAMYASPFSAYVRPRTPHFRGYAHPQAAHWGRSGDERYQPWHSPRSIHWDH